MNSIIKSEKTYEDSFKDKKKVVLTNERIIKNLNARGIKDCRLLVAF